MKIPKENFIDQYTYKHKKGPSTKDIDYSEFDITPPKQIDTKISRRRIPQKKD